MGRQRFRAKRRHSRLAGEDDAQAPALISAAVMTDVAVEKLPCGVVAVDRATGARQTDARVAVAIEPGPAPLFRKRVDLVAAPGAVAHQRQQAKAIQESEQRAKARGAFTFDGSVPISTSSSIPQAFCRPARLRKYACSIHCLQQAAQFGRRFLTFARGEGSRSAFPAVPRNNGGNRSTTLDVLGVDRFGGGANLLLRTMIGPQQDDAVRNWPRLAGHSRPEPGGENAPASTDGS